MKKILSSLALQSEACRLRQAFGDQRATDLHHSLSFPQSAFPSGFELRASILYCLSFDIC